MAQGEEERGKEGEDVSILTQEIWLGLETRAIVPQLSCHLASPADDLAAVGSDRAGRG
jgi:hypothetical protein